MLGHSKNDISVQDIIDSNMRVPQFGHKFYSVTSGGTGSQRMIKDKIPFGKPNKEKNASFVE